MRPVGARKQPAAGPVGAPRFTKLPTGEPENYAALGERLEMSETALRSLAMRLRRRWRELIRHELENVVRSRAEVDAEMASLQAALMD